MLIYSNILKKRLRQYFKGFEYLTVKSNKSNLYMIKILLQKNKYVILDFIYKNYEDISKVLLLNIC